MNRKKWLQKIKQWQIKWNVKHLIYTSAWTLLDVHCIRTRQTYKGNMWKSAKSQTIYNIQNIYWFMLVLRVFFFVLSMCPLSSFSSCHTFFFFFFSREREAWIIVVQTDVWTIVCRDFLWTISILSSIEKHMNEFTFDIRICKYCKSSLVVWLTNLFLDMLAARSKCAFAYVCIFFFLHTYFFLVLLFMCFHSQPHIYTESFM